MGPLFTKDIFNTWKLARVLSDTSEVLEGYPLCFPLYFVTHSPNELEINHYNFPFKEKLTSTPFNSHTFFLVALLLLVGNLKVRLLTRIQYNRCEN